MGHIWPISATYLSDYSLSDYLFFTKYIKEFVRKANEGVLTQALPIGYATDFNLGAGAIRSLMSLNIIIA